MIRVERPNEAPPMLLSRGNTATQQDHEAYDGHPDAYRSGVSKFTFSDNIYGSDEIREILATLQHDKCCYCESKPRATSPLQIDHFRPKGAVRQSKGSERIHPGYYWLAYRWDNLVLACEECNRKKSDFFPLEDPGQRTRNHRDPLDQESPLLLNPYVETDPGEHLTFDGSACQPGTERGRVTVTFLGLNRPKLQEERQEVLEMLALLRDVARHPDGSDTIPPEVRDAMDSFARPGKRYIAMVRDYLSTIDAETDDPT